MNFLYPSFLWALAALAIPVIIHLFNFQRPKKVQFTNVRFLKSVKEATNSARQLRQWLILLMRLLFVACVVLAFAQPFLASKNSNVATQGRMAVSAYIDNSYSMQSETQQGQALDAAAARWEALLGAYPKNTQFHLLTNDFDGKSQYFVNADKMHERIAEIKLSNHYRDLVSINNRQNSAYEALPSAGTKEVFWFSDFQRSTAGDLSKLEFDSTKQYYVVPVQASQTANVYIDSVWLETPFVRANENNQLKVRVFNAGDKAISNLPLRLFIDEVQVSTSAINLEPQAAATTQFSFSISSEAAHKARISLNDLPVTFDNEYYFVLKGAPRMKIMHIFDESTPYIKAVFANNKLFDTQHFSQNNIRYDAFAQADLVILDGLPSIDAGLADALQKCLRRGQSIALFPSAKANAESYKNLFTNKLGSVLLQQTTDTARQALQMPDARNPFFEGVFESAAANTGMPQVKPSLAWGGSGVPLLKYKNGNAFLSVWKNGQSKFYLCAAPLDKTNQDFAQHAFFVPVMYRMAILSLRNAEPLAFSFQQPSIELAVDTVLADQVFTLEKDKTKVIPSQRVADKKLLLELPKSEMESGYYDLKINNKTVKTIALNYGKSESRMAYYSPEQLREIFSAHRNVKVFDTVDKQNITDEFRAKNIGQPLWQYALMLALAFLLGEVLIIRFWK